MKTSKEHFESLKRFRPMFEALAYFMDDAETFNSLKQAHAEVQMRLADKREEEKSIDSRLEAIAVREKAIDEAARDAARKRENLIEDARKKGFDIVSEAKEQAQRVIELAQLEAKNIKAPYEKQRDDLVATIEYRKKDIAELDAKHAELKASHDKIQDAIATAKAQASHILKA